MKKIYTSIANLVGKTPLVALSKIELRTGATVAVKLESFNPCGSIKDRTALSMIEDAEACGLISVGTTIVEPTSGNTGIGLAWVCAQKDYRLVLCMPDTMSIERKKLLLFFGAETVLTPGEDGMSGAVRKAEEIASKTEKAFMPHQFKNEANPRVHFETTGPEIWEDTDGEVDIVVGGIGTGGTMTGVSRFLKGRKPSVITVGVEPFCSPVLSGGTPGPHKIQGIGAGFFPEVLDLDLIDEIVRVTAQNAASASRRLARQEGILCGISSGASLHAACEIANRKESDGKLVVAILPDTGERYVSTWLFDE
ncbi:MAG: cysteine synthase A [Spirochaetes bacterium]|nr:cysteine synthase A [Spirochaetota bacterium]